MMFRLIQIARDLKSESGENPEYDRALVEMVMYFSGCLDDDREYIESIIGVVKNVNS